MAFLAFSIMTSKDPFGSLGTRTLKRLREKWAELLILAITVPALVWLITLVFDLASKMKAVEMHLTQSAKNTAELRVGITAAASINQPFRSAIVVFKSSLEGEDWKMNVEIWDPVDGKVSTYTAKLDKRRKELLEVSLIAIVKKVDFDALNFKEMEEMARLVGLGSRSLPDGIIRDDSFVVNSDPMPIEGELKSFGFEKIASGSAKGVDTWRALREALHKRYGSS